LKGFGAMGEHVVLKIDGHVAEIRLNRPRKINAVTSEMAADLASMCARVDADEQVRVVLVSGEGPRGFCAGSDLNSLADYPSLMAYRNRVEYSAAFRHLRKPAVAALTGWVLGGGAEIALSTDIRIADTTARIGFPEVKNGWVGGGAATQLLPRLVGYGQAMYLQLLGEPIAADRALAIGLVEEVVPAGKALDRAREICVAIAALRPLAVESVKAAIRAALSVPLEEGARLENELTTLCFAEGKHMEGIEAFNERRGPGS
jgi:enoyl-CoA hydratase